ncbi:hypothetical protein HID58_077466 [Brassica napus]|uniref:Non-specific serine/threonine protein kinase n=1 Tax=Brassica napus TaxID=3708 RepID=A0ABQ7YQH3_BRANA|nr:hypothetical protein HID58_077466 [Brassica napus]
MLSFSKMRFLSCSMIYLFLVLQLQTLLVSSENIINGSIPVGESLTASESQQFSSSWRSPSGDFAFGFRKIQPNHGFTLSIWFDKIPDKTIVWHAQAVNTTTGLVPEGSKVTLTPDRGLVITDPRGQQHWISSLPPGSGSVSRGLITDAGNFRLLSKDSGEDLWLSFDHPTDTLLPTQSIEIGSNLSSRLTETSFKKGRFRLHLGDDGDLKLLVLNSKSLAETDVYFSYYESGTTEPNPGTRLVFNQSGYMYVLRSDNATRFGIKENVPVSSGDVYRRAVLHFDGVFAQYHHSKEQGSNGWELAWAVPDNICEKSSEEALGNVACGFNSICILGDDQRPKCQCPEKFSLMDPSDEYGDCKPDFEMQTCGPENNKTENVHVNVYELMRVDRTNWPYGDYQRYKNYDEDTCRNACLSDCFCAAVVYGNDRVCWLKRFPLSFGQRAPNGNHDDRRDSYTLIKVLKGVVDVPVTRYRGRNSGWLIIACSVLLGTSALFNFILLALYRRMNKRKKKRSQARDIGPATSTAVELNLRVFTYRELVVATGDFMDELGRGDDLEAIEDMEMVERYVKIGIWCIQEESGLRPNMRNITQMLEGVTQVRDPPNPCPYSVLSCDEYLSCGPNIINGSIPVGESLTASESQQFSSSWRSPSGDFAFGFRKIQPNDGFTLSVWFDKIPDKTIVWHAQAVNTTTGLVPAGSNVTLTADRGLVLTDPRGQQLWSSSLPPSNGSVSQGRINDAGNFGLLSETTEDSGEFLWSSFANPTDTLLPTQGMEVGRNLSSRLTETSFSKGRYRLHLGNDGDLRLLTLNPETLLESDINFAYYAKSNPGTQLVFNESGYMYILQRNNSRFYLKEDVPPENICAKGFGTDLAANEVGNLACGFNNICSLGDNQRPRCQCPERFVLSDPSDSYGDCKPDFEMHSCGAKSNQTDVSLYEFVTLEKTNWPSGDYKKYSNYDEERCKASCLNDCFCAAVVFRTICWKKKFPLSYGHRSPTGGSDTFIKVRKLTAGVPNTGRRGKGRDWLIITCSVLLGTSALVNFILLYMNRNKKRMAKKPNQRRYSGAATATDLNLRVFTYRDLVVATGDFVEELGRGAFGIVYKGVLKVSGDSEVNVAVKKLDRVAQESEKEFKNEVKVIGQIHHKNLVKLIGFCDEGQSRLIVYELLPNGTLAEALDNMDLVERYVKIGIWCIQEEPGKRPNMRNVTQMLEGVAQVNDPPNPSPYNTFTCAESMSN